MPGVLGFAFMSFAIPVLVIEDAKVLTALRRGIDLASKRFGALLGLYAVVLLVIVMAVIGIVSVAPIEGWMGIIVFWALIVVIFPILMMVTTAVVVHLYRDLREQRGELAARNPAA